MMFDAIDSAWLAVPDLDTACLPYERLGLRLSPAWDGRRTLHVGGPGNLFSFHFLSDRGSDSPLAQPLRRALAAGRSLFAVAIGVADLDTALGLLERKGLRATRLRDGEDNLAWLHLHDEAGTDLVLVQQIHPLRDRHAAAVQEGLLDHGPRLKRLDHLAVVAHNLDEKTRYWADVLGVPVAGEVTTPAMVIRQLRVGDAVLELLGPASPDSPIWQRPPGLVGMISWEVGDLDAAVAQARAAGFSVTDPATGVLPGTRVATIQGTELAGVNMQLLQYV